MLSYAALPSQLCTESITLSRLSYIPSVLVKNCCLTSVNYKGKNHDTFQFALETRKEVRTIEIALFSKLEELLQLANSFWEYLRERKPLKAEIFIFNYAAGEIVLSLQENGEEEKQVRFQVCMLFQIWGRMSKLQTKTLATAALRIPHYNCQRGKASLRGFCSSPTSCS